MSLNWLAPVGLGLDFFGGLLGGVTQQQQADRARRDIRRMQTTAGQAARRGARQVNTVLNEGTVNDAEALAGLSEQLLGGYEKRAADMNSYVDAATNEIYGGYNTRLNEALAGLEGMGAAAHARLDTDYTNAERAGVQDLTERGLTGSTILPSMRAGVADLKNQASQSLDEQLRRERTATQAQLSGDALGALTNLRAAGLNTLGQTSADYLGALDATRSREVASNQANRGARVGQLNADLDRSLGIIQAPYAQVQGPPPPNWGTIFGDMGNNLLGYSIAMRPQPTNNDALWGSLGGSAIGGAFGLGSAGILGASLSDRNAKTGKRRVRDKDALDALEEMPVSYFRYKPRYGDDNTHVGPMAQDFHGATGRGDGRHIPVQDHLGLLTAAVRALARRGKATS